MRPDPSVFAEITDTVALLSLLASFEEFSAPTLPNSLTTATRWPKYHPYNIFIALRLFQLHDPSLVVEGGPP